LACQASDVFGAVAPVAGCLMKWIHDSCNPVLPIPVFEIHGTDDDITYWNGDMNNEQGYGAYLAVPTTFQFWAQLNNCTESIVDILPDVNKSDGSMVISQKYFNGVYNNEVWLYKVVNGGHDWPGNGGNMDIHASEEIWNFFATVHNNATNVLTENENPLPENVVLHQNYPNPFNPVTTISFELQDQAQVKLSIFDILGRKSIKLVNTIQSAGFKSVQWDGTDNLGQPVCAGVYFYRIEVGQIIQTRKMVLLR
jgi:polyhydroxybutyrate depolymerase